MSRSTLTGLHAGNKISRFLKMEEKQTENFTVLDEFGKLKIFNSATDIIKYFVKFRMEFYIKRKAFIIDKIKRELLNLSNKARFIKMIIDGKLKINNVARLVLIGELTKYKFDEIDGSFSYLLSMTIHTLTKEKYQELLNQESDKNKELVNMRKLQPTDMYITDLGDLKKVLKKEYNN